MWGRRAALLDKAVKTRQAASSMLHAHQPKHLRSCRAKCHAVSPATGPGNAVPAMHFKAGRSGKSGICCHKRGRASRTFFSICPSPSRRRITELAGANT